MQVVHGYQSGSQVVKHLFSHWCQFDNSLIDAYYHNFHGDILLVKQGILRGHRQIVRKCLTGKASNDFHTYYKDNLP